VAELADAQVSEACDGDIVEVQVLSSAPASQKKGKASLEQRLAFLCLILEPQPAWGVQQESLRSSYKEHPTGCLPKRNQVGQSVRGEFQMRAERAATIEPAIESSRDNRDHRPQESFVAVPRLQLKIAKRPARNRVQRLLELAGTLLRETETLARDKAFTEDSNRLRTLDLSEGIDFYDEVQRFETGLIRLALDQTRGHQARAAKLLHIKPTTLNSKIKLYGIEY
jgi:DNA-binding protein Fis